MESNTAEKIEVAEDNLTLETIHESFQTDFDKLERRLEITEDNLHADSRNINMHVAEIIQEERDQKKNMMAMLGCLIVLNIVIAIIAVVTVTVIVSQ